MAPTKAAATVDCWISDGSTIPPPIILATAVDMKAPAIFKTAASSTARPGVRTWVETTVAIALRSEEHTSELQSLAYLVCRLLLEKKKIKQINDSWREENHLSKQYPFYHMTA